MRPPRPSCLVRLVRPRLRLAILLGAVVSGTSSPGCSEDRALDAFPAAVLELDTNLPVPLAISRLRIDVYDQNGRWIDSSDFARPDPRDWPTSFGVYTEREAGETAWVRIRAYLDGEVIDYRGERLRDWPNPFKPVDPTPDEAPRLVRRGLDVTPRVEPQPLATVDRLLRVPLRAKAPARVRALLDGACVGTMVEMGPGGLPGPSAKTCVDAEKKRVEVALAPSETTSATTSRQATWKAAPCDEPSGDTSGRVCIPGGATVIGSRGSSIDAFLETGEGTTPPVRIFGVRRFWLDRHEVTVARFRAALDRGLRTPLPKVNDADLSTDDPCTYSSSPRGREGLPLVCVDWLAARDFCRFEGGDLPTEVEWEHAATVAGHAQKQLFPWGGAPLGCNDVVFGRGPPGFSGTCRDKGLLPASVTEGPADLNPLGVHGLAGGAREWSRDVFAPFGWSCWAEAPLADPLCRSVNGDFGHTFRGGSWLDGLRSLALRPSAGLSRRGVDAAILTGELVYQPDVSFRCAYEGDGQ